MAIKYKNIMEKLKEIGVSQKELREAGVLSQSTVARLRANQTITSDTIDTLCQLLHCTPNDIIEISYNE